MSFIWLNSDENGMVRECVMTVKDVHKEKLREIMKNKSLKSAYDVSNVANRGKKCFSKTYRSTYESSGKLYYGSY